jgi:hypothetical protein
LFGTLIANKIIKSKDMGTNLKMKIENELNIQKRNLELLNMLESKCEGLENLLCKNLINRISKKIDSIEKKISNEINNENYKIQDIRIQGKETLNTEDEKIAELNNNLKVIQNNFSDILTNSNFKSSEIISKKIEENYKLLDELEKTNRPIFSQTTEINKRFFIEDKIKEMDNKLSLLFSSNNNRNKPVNGKEYHYQNIRQNDVKIQRTAYTTTLTNDSFIRNNLNPASEKIDLEKEKEQRIKDLYNKLNQTERNIKDIAGNILKNF